MSNLKAKINTINKQIKNSIASSKKVDKETIREVRNICLEIIEMAESGKISLKETDHLFGGLFNYADFLPKELEDIIFEGGKLELPESALGKNPLKLLKEIKKKLINLKI